MHVTGVFIRSPMEVNSCVMHFLYLLLACLCDPAASPGPPSLPSLPSPPSPSPPPPPDLPVCRTAPLSPPRLSATVCVFDCQRGWGQPTQPLQSPSNRAVWCGTGRARRGWGLVVQWLGRAKSSRIRKIERRRKGEAGGGGGGGGREFCGVVGD